MPNVIAQRAFKCKGVQYQKGDAITMSDHAASIYSNIGYVKAKTEAAPKEAPAKTAAPKDKKHK